MSRLVLGLDIGSYSIKAALVKKGFRRPELIDFKQVILGEESVAAALRYLLSSIDLKGTYVVTSFPASASSYRLLTLPFDDPRQVSEVLPLELQGQIPFSLDQVLIDYQTLDVTQGSSYLLGVSAVKSPLYEYVNCFKDAGMEPQVIEAGPIYLHRLFKFAVLDNKGCQAVIDLGASKSLVCIIASGNLRLARTIPNGGEALNQALQQSLGISREEAEEVKRTAGLEGNEPSQLLHEALGPLTEEIWRTLSIFEGGSGIAIEEIYLCGGLSHLRGIEDFLHERLGREVKSLRPLTGFDTKLEGVEETEGLMAGALGLALRAIHKERGHQINFRASGIARAVEPESIRSKGIALGALALILAVLYGLNLYTNFRRQEAQYTALKRAEAQLFNQILPTGEKGRANSIKAKVTQLEKELAAFPAIEKGFASSLDLLQEVTSRLPKEREMALKEYLFERDRIKILGETGSFEAVEQLRQELKAFQGFKEVRVESAEAKEKEKGVAFDLTILLGGTK